MRLICNNYPFKLCLYFGFVKINNSNGLFKNTFGSRLFADKKYAVGCQEIGQNFYLTALALMFIRVDGCTL